MSLSIRTIPTTAMHMLLVCSLLWPIGAHAATPSERQIDEMTDVMVSMLPVGAVMDQVAAKDAAWPMQDNPDKVDATQLACLRRELSSPGVRKTKRAEVAVYAAAHPSSFAKELQVARDAAPLFGKLVGAGMQAGVAGTEVDYGDALKSATTDEFMAMLTFSRDPAYSDLRALSGFGDSIADADAETSEKNASRGKAIGELLITRLMLDAMETCDVPISSIFE